MDFVRDVVSTEAVSGNIKLHPQRDVADIMIHMPATSTSIDFSENRYISLGFSTSAGMVRNNLLILLTLYFSSNECVFVYMHACMRVRACVHLLVCACMCEYVHMCTSSRTFFPATSVFI